ncbi:c-type cytochrome [Maritalea mediterranea]|uniref:Cytochrome c n=1 Tax=Maritalea mediterranea TaxID=2909667 RepID=A0ABS9E6Y3_9HYPH|nr:cytochrome c [Maritalea mediterranea]MCF4098636.1 cytochrome c [Maritalea mediterranea]
MRKKTIVFFAGAAAFAVVSALAVMLWPIGKEPQLETLEGNAQRGAYLARMSGCIACHTDAENGGAPLAGGVELATEFGTFYSPNLTMSAQHGMGEWTIEMFAKAVRQGVSPDGEPYYPSFPYPFYAKLTDQDIADLWAAFQTVPGVDEPSKPHQMRFPYNMRAGLKVWRAAFLNPKPFEPDPSQSKAWNRGKYIVEGPAHCGACHTPRNFAGAREASFKFQGADKLPDGGKSPSIHSFALKEKGWTQSTLAYALKSGIKPDGDVFGGSMVEVVRDGTSFLTPQDLEAIATYLVGANDDAAQ